MKVQQNYKYFFTEERKEHEYLCSIKSVKIQKLKITEINHVKV